jgi:uncharacterized RDD family membrane protein YckC
MTRLRYAGFWIRFLADVIDTVILTCVAWLVQLMVIGALSWAFYLTGRSEGLGAWASPDSFASQIINAAIYLAVAAPYYVIGHARYGTTLGKRPFSVFVVSARDFGPISTGQSMGRALAYGASYALMGVGFLMVAFHPEKRGLHDLLAGTVSIRRRKSAGPAPVTVTVQGTPSDHSH